MTDAGEKQFQERLLATFGVEAREHVDAITAGLLTLEKGSEADAKAGGLESLSREAHSLKGAARVVGRTDIEALCQSLESVLAALRSGKLASSPELFDTLHRAADGLRSVLGQERGSARAARDPLAGELRAELDVLLEEGGAADRALPAARPPAASFPQAAGGPGSTVRVSTARLDAVVGWTEDLLAAKRALSKHAVELRALHGQVAASRTSQASALAPLQAAVAGLASAAETNARTSTAAVDALLLEMKQLVMQPFSTLLDVFPKLIRDLSRENGKEADVVLRGAETQIDRRILEQMKDPLVHIARNCVDHGIEKPEVRSGKGKPRRGTVIVTVSQRDGGSVELTVEDDGAGIDAEKVKAAAARIGLLSRERADSLLDADTLPLVFHSGVSTSPMITDVSGRGLGLAIARERVQKLGGEISVHAPSAGGTVFRMVLPITASTMRAVIVSVQGRLFALPCSWVQRVLRVDRETIVTAGGQESVRIGGSTVPLATLSGLLGIPADAADPGPGEKLPAVVLEAEDRRMVLLVDEVVDDQEILVKPLGSRLRRVPNVSGVTVLGDGEIVPVLVVPVLMDSAARAAAAGQPAASKAEARRTTSVLVVEDSITSRTLLKNILESAGYEVAVAVDGVEALSLLGSGTFDIVVSDIQMPRMDGFDLTAKVRADKRLEELPVILVTSLESPEDRTRGIEVGANAYIAKSSFDQSNLLEVMGRLL